MEEGALERIRNGEAVDEMTVLAALREELERLDPQAKVEVSGEAGKEMLQIERGSGEIGTLALHNLWTRLRGLSGAAAAQEVERFASIGARDVASLEEAAKAAKVMPLVISREWAQKLDPELVCRELSTCGTLIVCLAFDAPDHVRYLHFSDLEEHDLGDPEEAERKALTNLASHVNEYGGFGVESKQILPEELRERSFFEDFRDILVHQVSLDGDYDASLPLLISLCRHLCEAPESPLSHLDGPLDMAFALPARGTFLIVDGREEHAPEALSPMARAIHLNEAYAISSQVYRYASETGPVMLKPVEP